ncbi:MAG: SDR family oxidoreductase [Desulfosarcinaceae bacterium]|nr:SDR family oxidoreductase [Desulfosarcinaceae bacterium]
MTFATTRSGVGKDPLKGQAAIVTGAGKGIGCEIARGLAAAGATVGLAGRRQADLAKTAEDIRTAGGAAIPLVVDVTDWQQVAAMAADMRAACGNIDLLVNNAGVLGTPGPWWVQAPEDWGKVFDVNLKGVMQCTQAVLPTMIAQSSGRIINIGSNAGIDPIAGMGPYAISKAALLRLTDTLHADLEGSGVTVFAVSPGLVKTDLSQKLPTYDQIPARQWLSAKRVAHLCLSIASGRADALSGRYLHVVDDIDALIADAERIITEDLQVLRLRAVENH